MAWLGRLLRVSQAVFRVSAELVRGSRASPKPIQMIGDVQFLMLNQGVDTPVHSLAVTSPRP